MRISYTVPRKPGLRCDVLESIAEGVVQAMREEIESASEKDPEKYPCCIKCAGFAVTSSPGFPVPGCPPPDTSRTLHIRSAAEMLRSGCGSSLDLACYQAAQKRLRGDDPECRVVVDFYSDEHGNEMQDACHAMVLHSDEHEKPEKRGGLDDPLKAAKATVCECGGHEDDG